MSKSKGNPKTVLSQLGFSDQRTPRTGSLNPPSSQDSHPTFSFKHIDRENREEWAWPESDGIKEIVDFLCTISNSTWKELRTHSTGSGIRRPLHHSQPFDSLPTKTQNLIIQLHLNEIFEDLFRFRLGGRKRLWGFLHNGIFYILWWDPEHKVYPLENE